MVRLESEYDSSPLSSRYSQIHYYQIVSFPFAGSQISTFFAEAVASAAAVADAVALQFVLLSFRTKNYDAFHRCSEKRNF